MRSFFRQIAVLMGIAAIPALGAAFFHPQRPSWQSDEVQVALVQSWSETVLWVDSRPAKEYDQDHIPGAFLLSEEAWDEGLAPLLNVWDPEKVVVVYCSSLSCQTSHEVAKRLREEVGLTRVQVLQGGWESWLRAKR